MPPAPPEPEYPKEATPKGWDPTKASPKELQKYFYPPKPDEKKEPGAHARWVEVAKRKPSMKPPGLGSSPPENALDEVRNWAGAILPRDNSESAEFSQITGTFIAPNIFPKLDPSDPDRYADGTYRLWPWLGLGGVHNKTVFQSGLTNTIVVKNGKITSPPDATAGVLYRWADGQKWGEDFIGADYTPFSVNTGDRLESTVWLRTEGHRKLAYGWIYNWTTNIYASVDFEVDRLQPTSAQWIVGGRNPDSSHPLLFPNFTDISFFQGFAEESKSGREFAISQAQTKDAEDVGSHAYLTDNHVIIQSTKSYLDSHVEEKEEKNPV